MRSIFIILALLLSVISYCQNTHIDSLIAERHRLSYESKYDSLLLVCNKIKTADKKIVEEEGIDFHIADAYFHLRQFETALDLGNKYLKRPGVKHSNKWRTDCYYKRRICFDFYDYYKEQGNKKLALKYILMVDKKYYFVGCSTGLDPWYMDLYHKIVDCYEAVNNTKGANIYRKKIEDLLH